MGTDGMPMPDLSHLTEDERAKIMEVMNRHKEEEKAEIQMYKSVEKQFGLYIKQGKQRSNGSTFIFFQWTRRLQQNLDLVGQVKARLRRLKQNLKRLRKRPRRHCAPCAGKPNWPGAVGTSVGSAQHCFALDAAPKLR